MSLNSKRPGTLSIVGTPLGNAEDLTPRARRCRAGLACARWGVTARRFVSLHDHNEERRKNAVLDALRDGRNLALISDAGMPVLADPGFLLVRACRDAGLPVTVLPGACAGLRHPPATLCFFRISAPQASGPGGGARALRPYSRNAGLLRAQGSPDGHAGKRPASARPA